MNNLEQLIKGCKSTFSEEFLVQQLIKKLKQCKAVDSYGNMTIAWLKSLIVEYHGETRSQLQVMTEFCVADVLTEIIRKSSKEYNRKKAQENSGKERGWGPKGYSKWLFGYADENLINTANQKTCTSEARVQSEGSKFEYVGSEAQKDFFRILYMLYNYEDSKNKTRLHPGAVVPLMAGNPWFTYGIERAWRLYELCKWPLQNGIANDEELDLAESIKLLEGEKELQICKDLNDLQADSEEGEEVVDLLDYLQGTSDMDEIWGRSIKWTFQQYNRTNFVFLRMFWYRITYEYWESDKIRCKSGMTYIDYVIGSTALILVLNKILKQQIENLLASISSPKKLLSDIAGTIEDVSSSIWSFVERPITWCYSHELLSEMVQYFRDQAIEHYEEMNEDKETADRYQKWKKNLGKNTQKNTEVEGFMLFESGFWDDDYDADSYNESEGRSMTDSRDSSTLNDSIDGFEFMEEVGEQYALSNWKCAQRAKGIEEISLSQDNPERLLSELAKLPFLAPKAVVEVSSKWWECIHEYIRRSEDVIKIKKAYANYLQQQMAFAKRKE